MTEKGGCVLYFFVFWAGRREGLVCHMDCEAHRGKGVECNSGSSFAWEEVQEGGRLSDSQGVNGLWPGGKGS